MSVAGTDVEGMDGTGWVEAMRTQGVRRCSIVAVLAILGATFLAACDPIVLTCTNWIGPSGGDWGISSNWDTGAVPGAGDQACSSSGAEIVVSGNQAAAVANIQGTVRVMPGSKLTVVALATISSLELHGTLDGPASVQIDHGNLTGGRVMGSGQFVITGAGGASTFDGLTIAGDRALMLGNLTWSGGMNLCDNAQVHAQHNVSITSPAALSGIGCITTAPSLIVDPGGSLLIDASLDASAIPVVNNGSLGGSGTLHANVRGSGALYPGVFGTAIFNIDGNFTPEPGAVLHADVAGTTPGTDYDRVAVTGTASLADLTADVDLTGGYTPSGSVAYPGLVTGGSVTGQPSTDLPAGPPNWHTAMTSQALDLYSSTGCDTNVFYPNGNYDGADLSGVDLSHCDLSFATFRFATLNGTNFTGATLIYTTFQNADLTNANFSAADLSFSVLPFATINGTKFVGTTLTATNYTDSVFTNVDMTDAYIEAGYFGGATITTSNFTRATLIDTDLVNAHFAGATLTGVRSGGIIDGPLDLPSGWLFLNGYLVGPGANLAGATLGGLSGSSGVAGANLTGATLTGADFTNANLTNVILTNTDVDTTNFTGATLTGVRTGGMTGTPTAVPSSWQLRNGHLVGPGANLAGANLASLTLASPGVSLAGANLAGANLGFTAVNGVNLTGATLRGADLSSTTFDNSVNLTDIASGGIGGSPTLPSPWRAVQGYLVGPKADLSGARLLGADLTSVNVTGANLAGAELTGSNLAGANLNNAAMGTTLLAGVRSGGVTGTPTALPTGWSIVSGYLVGPYTNLVGANLNSAALAGKDLSGANLQNAGLGGADLTGANLQNANLFGVTSGLVAGVPATLPANWILLSGYLMGPGANLSSANLAGLNLSTARLDAANLSGVIIHGATLAGATLGRVRSGGISGVPSGLPAGWMLKGGYLVGPTADLDGANLSNVSLSGANLTGATLVSATMTTVDYTGATLANADFTNANMTASTFNNTIIGGTKLFGATFTGVHTVSPGVIGAPASLPSSWSIISGYLAGPGANLNSANLDGIYVVGIDLTGASLANASVKTATLQSVNLTNANLSGTNFNNTNLSNSTLSGSNVQGANLGLTNLFGVFFFGATGTPTNYLTAFYSSTRCPDNTVASFNGAQTSCAGHPW